MSLRWSEWMGVTGCLLLAAACPLPDQEIEVITEDLNNSPVRLIEPVGLSKAQRCECDPGAVGCDPDEETEEFEAECPLPLAIKLPHFMDPAASTDYQFCKCGAEDQDDRRLPAVQFYAEDQDKEPEVDEPADLLRAALLLNALPDASAAGYVAYTQFHSPSTPLQSAAGYEPDGRPKPYVRTIYVGDAEARWDLCKDDKAKLGFNTVTVLVTDRDWNEVVNPDGEQVIEDGVVDVANGATYDTSTYTFYCSSAAEEGDPFGCADRCKPIGE